jgi:hypothetical protein
VLPFVDFLRFKMKRPSNPQPFSPPPRSSRHLSKKVAAEGRLVAESYFRRVARRLQRRFISLCRLRSKLTRAVENNSFINRKNIFSPLSINLAILTILKNKHCRRRLYQGVWRGSKRRHFASKPNRLQKEQCR